MRTKTMFAMVIIAIFALCLAVSQPAVASDEEEVLQVSKDFVKGLETDDSKLLNSLYWQSPDISKWGPGGDEALLSQGWEPDDSETDSNEEAETTSVVVQKIGGKWLIVHDHGSFLPTE